MQSFGVFAFGEFLTNVCIHLSRQHQIRELTWAAHSFPHPQSD